MLVCTYLPAAGRVCVDARQSSKGNVAQSQTPHAREQSSPAFLMSLPCAISTGVPSGRVRRRWAFLLPQSAGLCSISLSLTGIVDTGIGAAGGADRVHRAGQPGGVPVGHAHRVLRRRQARLCPGTAARRLIKSQNHIQRVVISDLLSGVAAECVFACAPCPLWTAIPPSRR